MAYGLRVRNSSGVIVLDTSDRITRFRYSNEVASGASGNTTLSDTSGLLTVEISVMKGYDYTRAPHRFTRSGTTYSWAPPSVPFINSSDSIIFVFLYT